MARGNWLLEIGWWLLARGEKHFLRPKLSLGRKYGLKLGFNRVASQVQLGTQGGFVSLFTVLFVLFLIPVRQAAGQIQADDSTLVRTDSVAVKSPNGALIRSAILPGWGQWYNGKKFKSLLVVGVEAGLIVNASIQNRKAQRATDENAKQFYENNRGLSIWWAAAVYLLNLLDAYVDAHLSDFDIGPDLSWRSSEFGGRTVLVAVSWSLSNKR